MILSLRNAPVDHLRGRAPFGGLSQLERYWDAWLAFWVVSVAARHLHPMLFTPSSGYFARELYVADVHGSVNVADVDAPPIASDPGTQTASITLFSRIT